MRNIFIFIIFANFSPLFAHTLPNNVIIDCNLPAPTNLHSVEVGPSYATMAWDAVPGATGYRVSWFNESGAQVNSDTTLDTEYEVQGLESGKTYNFRVASVCSSGGTGTIYSTVIIVPIVTELVISTDNPLGNLNLVCEKDINPMAECTFDFNVATTYIGKIKVNELNRVYYFRIRYLIYEGKEGNSKVLLDLIKPEFYPELPVPKPRLLTENDEPVGKIHDHANAKINNLNNLFTIRITKLYDKIYKINLKNISLSNFSLEFLYYYKSTSQSIMNNNLYDDQSNEASNLILEHKNIETLKVEIFNLLGEKITEFYQIFPDDSFQDLAKNMNLSNGVYMIHMSSTNYFSTKKIIVNHN